MLTVKHMKKFLLIALMLFSCIVLTGCFRLNFNYYIRYEMDVNTNYTGDVGFITVSTDHGELSFHTGTTFAETFGPVGPNFTARIRAFSTAHQAQVNLRIYACRGEETFALKKTASFIDPSERYPALLEYTIDF